MTIFLLLVSFAVILIGCELFVNGIEWFGVRLHLGEGAVGSVLAAVGTALPETIIPLVAILLTRTQTGDEIGIGAILGAPFMLSTLALLVCAIALLVGVLLKRRTIQIQYNRTIMRRDLGFFLVAYAVAALVGVFDIGPFRYAVAAGLVVGYGFYVKRTFASEGDLEGNVRALYFHSTSEAPDLRRVILQIVVALAAIIFGADLFVRELTKVAEVLGISALAISLLITPLATELPEKFNSASWMLRRKDTLALGNITGAMVFQSTFPVSIGLIFTSWHLGSENWHGLLAVGLALISGLVLYTRVRFSKGFGVGSLLFGGVLYAVFLVVTLLTL